MAPTTDARRLFSIAPRFSLCSILMTLYSARSSKRASLALFVFLCRMTCCMCRATRAHGFDQAVPSPPCCLISIPGLDSRLHLWRALSPISSSSFSAPHAAVNVMGVIVVQRPESQISFGLASIRGGEEKLDRCWFSGTRLPLPHPSHLYP